MGVLGALLAAHIRPQKPWILRLLAGIGALGLLAVLCFEDRLWRCFGNGTLLLLTFSAVLLLLAFHWQGTAKAIPGTGWLRSFGLLSYEIYLTHMFVVWPVVRGFKASGGGFWWGILWYVPAVALSWLLGWLVARYISIPCERALRQRLLKSSPSVESLAIG
jgi:peptidoglycan/LPS O-acetylase OafA/YrhL